MPACQNCERHVSERYRRVFGVDGQVPVCIHCEDIIRGMDGTIRDARSQRRADQNHG